MFQFTLNHLESISNCLKICENHFKLKTLAKTVVNSCSKVCHSMHKQTFLESDRVPDQPCIQALLLVAGFLVVYNVKHVAKLREY